MNKALIAGLMAAVAVPLFAQAPAAPRAPMASHTPMGMMADKVMTRAEVAAMVQAHFAKMDANRDGFIAADEMKMGHGKMKMDHGAMKGMDGEHAMADPAKAFDRLDANRDGMISRDEFAKGREVRIERRVEMRGAPGAEGARPMRMQGRMGGHGMGMMRGHMLKMADANKDGRISLQEATTGALQHFDMVDTNRDGRITPEERRSMRGKMAPMHGQKAG